MNTKYDDILYAPHHISPTKPQISMTERAAQFSPFAALNGHDAAIRETARLTDNEIEMTEDALNELNRKFRLLSDGQHDSSVVKITFFRPDDRKTGGSYHTICGVIQKIDAFGREIHLANGMTIPLDAVYDISADHLRAKKIQSY